MDLNIEIEKCVAEIKNGKIAIIPTDTIWGISCDALNEKAIEKCYEIKSRPLNKPLIVLLQNINQLPKFFDNIPPIFYELFQQSENPTTFILPNAKKLPSILKSEQNKVAIRIPKNGIIQDILKQLKHPITSTSANFAGEITPIVFPEIKKTILEKVDYVFPFLSAQHNSESRSKSSKIVEIFEDNRTNVIRV